MATLTLTLDEIVPLLKENFLDPRVRDIHTHHNELRATFLQKIMGKTVPIPISIRFIRYESPALTVRIGVKGKWGIDKLINSILGLVVSDKDMQNGIRLEGRDITLDLNRFLAARKITFIITRIEPIGNQYQVDFMLDHNALQTH